MKKEKIEFDEGSIFSTKEGLEKLIFACEKAIEEGSYISEDFTHPLVIEKVEKSFFEREFIEPIKDRFVFFFIIVIFLGSLFVGFITILSYIKKLF